MLNYLYVGVGQCGNKMVDCFASFKGKAIALNTTDKDMICLTNMEKQNLLNIAAKGTNGGAGKTPILGQKAMQEHLPDVLEKISATGVGCDYIVLCGGLGGGTGSGGIPVLLHELLTNPKAISTEKPPKVMLILTLPDDTEGADVQINAFNALITILRIIEDRNVPYILIDNNKIKAKMQATGDFDWRSVNLYLGKILSQFNRDANKNSPYVTFDETDYKKVMYVNGMTVLVKTKMDKSAIATENSIPDAIRKEWSKNSFYVDFDAATATMMTSVVEAPAQFLEDKENYKLIESGLLKLRSSLGSVSQYGGIYPYDSEQDANKQESVIVYCLLTGLKAPTEKMERLQERAQTEQDALQKKANANQVDLSGFNKIGAAAKPKKAKEEKPQQPLFTTTEDDLNDLAFL